MSQLSKADIRKLFELLNKELAQQSATGELYLVGGAVMSLVYEARPSTADVDALFKPTKVVRDAAQKVAEDNGFDSQWLNDAVKGFLSDNGHFDDYLELSNLKVYCAQPEYLLAMKCLSMRIGKEFHDEADVRYLLRFLNIEAYQDALAIVTRYSPLERFPQKTLYALEEILLGA